MREPIVRLIGEWRKRNIEGRYYATSGEALAQLLSLVPVTAAVGVSGSRTLEELGAVAALESRGTTVHNQYREALSREEGLALRRRGAQADVYLASPNAIAETGELVFFSAFGNRTAGISSAKQVVLVAGTNKIVPTLADAISRSREYVTPLNCKRLNFRTPCLADGRCREAICRYPEYRRMCCQVLVIEAEAEPHRMTVLLVGETLGF